MDFESRSAAELKKTGAYKYSLDPTTRPTCLSIKVHGIDGIVFLDFYRVNLRWREQPKDFVRWWLLLIYEGFEFSAHNAFFERCLYENILVKRYGWPRIPVKRWRCTAAKAAACALPRNLEGAGSAMNLAVQKDKRGYVAMMATCKPTRVWKKWKEVQEKVPLSVRAVSEKTIKIFKSPEPKMFLEPEDAPDVWRVLYEYCQIDTRSEECLDDSLPDLIPEEQEIWHLNQTVNWRGLRVDVATVQKIVDMMSVESKKKLKALDSLTMGLVTKPGARKSILEFLELEGVKLPNLQAKTVDDKLSGFDLSPDMRQLLAIRKALSMTSTRKYQGFLQRAGEDDRVRDILLYHGASTGRESGTGVQPHNFPKGVIQVDENRPYAHVDNVAGCHPDMLRVLYGDSLAVLFSSILRNMIIPSEGHDLYVGDFSVIEVACLWWLAGNEPGLAVLRAGKDPYRYMAATNTGKRYDEIEVGDERQLGKAQVLGCGFGMGWERFQKTAWDMYRLKLSDGQSKLAVTNYRQANPAVPQLWKDYETAAIDVVEAGSDSAMLSVGRCRFYTKKKFLVICLPSGRRLRYREPQIAWRETDYGPRKTLEFYAVNSKTKHWGLERSWGGTISENITQGTARDLLMPAMVRLEKAGYRALLTVHDEAVCESKTGKGSVEEFVQILCQVPSWAKGLPIKAKGWMGPRYRK